MKSIFLILLVALMPLLMAQRVNSQTNISDAQKELVSLVANLPTNSPLAVQAFLSASLDDRTKSVPELVEIFMTNRDWTESLPQKQLDDWDKSHPYDSPPVIIHGEQSDAAYQLSLLGSRAKAATQAMIQSLTNSDLLTHQWALNHKSVDEERASSLNRHWTIQVLQAIGSVSPDVIPALVNELDDGRNGYEAAEALVKLAPNNTNVLRLVITKLEANLNSPEAKNSVQVLNGMGNDATNAITVLTQLLEHTNDCQMVVNTLGKMGANAAPAVPALINLYRRSKGDGNYAIRHWITITLGQIGPAAKEAVPLLQGVNRYANPDAQRALRLITQPNFARTNSRPSQVSQ